MPQAVPRTKVHISIDVRVLYGQAATHLLFRIFRASTRTKLPTSPARWLVSNADEGTGKGREHTVALRLIPTVLARTAHGCSTMTKTQQKKAVTKVLPARDHRRPSLDSISHAPN